MLAYAASRPVLVDRRPYPNAMLLIIGAHVAALALVMSAKMDLPRHLIPPITKVTFIKAPTPPPPIGVKSNPSHNEVETSIDHTNTKVPIPPQNSTGIDPASKVDTGVLGGGGIIAIPALPNIDPAPVKIGPQLLTAPSDLKPPYPQSKIDSGEEAMLTLKLKIDANGRVVAVDPVGRADPVFLEAARRHLVAHWRYKPATEDGRAVDSSAVITLHFQLDA